MIKYIESRLMILDTMRTNPCKVSHNGYIAEHETHGQLLGYHKTIDIGYDWVVTHVPTGISVSYFVEEEQCKSFCKKVYNDCDLTNNLSKIMREDNMSDITQKEKERLKEIIRYYAREVFKN